MSDTPRTDAASVSREYIEREMNRYTQKFVLADHMSDLERELAEARKVTKTKMTLAELRNMIRMSNTITFAKHMQRAEPEEIERVFLACINEWLRGDDELTRLKRGKNT